MTKGFVIFLNHFHKTFPDGINDANWWSTIANGTYIMGTAQEGDIWSPIHQIIHRLITFSINQRKEGDKVSSLDVFFLWSIITPDVFCNLPHCMTDFLASRAGKDNKGALLIGGMLIMKLSRSYGVFELWEARFLTL